MKKDKNKTICSEIKPFVQKSKTVQKGKNKNTDDDIKRTALVWSCISFPANKLRTVNEIHGSCRERIKINGLSLKISKEQIRSILKIAFSFGTIMYIEKGENSEYQIAMIMKNRWSIRKPKNQE